MIRIIACGLAIVALLGGVCDLRADSGQHDCWDVVQVEKLQACIVELNDRLFREVMVHGNTSFLDSVAFPETILVAPGGIERRGASEGQPGLPKVEEIEVRNETVLMKGETAVVAGTLELKGTMDGRSMPPKVRYLTVFVETEDGWRMLARSLAPVIRPGGGRPSNVPAE